jgi:hypothetical protein
VAEFASATSSWPTNFPIKRKVTVMIPNLPVHTHIDLVKELSRKGRVLETDDHRLSSCHVGELHLEPSISLARRLYQSLAATYDRIRHRQLAQGEPCKGATAHYTPHPR